jgi:hypothetical protein
MYRHHKEDNIGTVLRKCITSLCLELLSVSGEIL